MKTRAKDQLCAKAGVGIELPEGGVAIVNVSAPRAEDAKRLVEWIFENAHLALVRRLSCWASYGYHAEPRHRPICKTVDISQAFGGGPLKIKRVKNLATRAESRRIAMALFGIRDAKPKRSRAPGR